MSYDIYSIIHQSNYLETCHKSCRVRMFIYICLIDYVAERESDFNLILCHTTHILLAKETTED
jgi:hypothetical protein